MTFKKIGVILFLMMQSWTVTKAAEQATSKIPSLKNHPKVNGIDIGKYDDFWRKWNLVTVRYRKDNGEQRFVYANNIAWKAMMDGAPKYPEGSILTKVAFITNDDNAFPNSAEPSSVSRMQFMVKDSKKYKDSDGWGYALVLASPRPSDAARDKSEEIACHACHKIVPDRDFVFSLPAYQQGGVKATNIPPSTHQDQFAEVALEQLPKSLKDLITKLDFADSSKVRVQRMPLFIGSIQESITPLSKYAHAAKIPYLIFDEVSGRLIVVGPSRTQEECKDALRIAYTPNIPGSSDQKRPDRIQLGKICGGIPQWLEIIPYQG